MPGVDTVGGRGRAGQSRVRGGESAGAGEAGWIRTPRPLPAPHPLPEPSVLSADSQGLVHHL